MSGFLNPIRAEDLPDGYHRKLLEDVVYHVGGPESKDKIAVPAGFEWDGGSVPKLFWNLVDPWGSASKAYLLHDWLYHTQDRSRLVSDAILLEAMEVLGVNLFKRLLIYRAVRLFGWKTYNGHAKKMEYKKPLPFFVLITACFLFSRFARAGSLVILEPYSNGCTVDDISPPNQSTTTWSSSYANQKQVLFQNMSTVDVYIGFESNISSQTSAVALYNQGDSLSLSIHGNQAVYFWGDGASAAVRALRCQ